MMSELFTCPLADGKIDPDFCLEIQECVDGILAFERDGRELTTRWDLDELTAWLRAFLEHMREDPYPVEAVGEYAAQKDDAARDFETDDEDEMEAYCDRLYE